MPEFRKGCLRLSKNVPVQEAIKHTADEIRKEATKQAIKELKTEIKGKILTRQQKLEILHNIATGTMVIPVKKPVWNNAKKKYITIPMHDIPDHAARIRAIEVDNKMNGDYEPDKLELTGKGGQPIETTVQAKLPDEIDYSKLPTDFLKTLLSAGRVKKEVDA
jgi:uncharacterized ubiquitin-like protein YukD